MFERSDLVVDVGHSRIKWARCSDGVVDDVLKGACSINEIDVLLDWIRQDVIERQPIHRVIWSPQGNTDVTEKLRDGFKALGVSCRSLTTGSIDLPVAPAYAQLGSDRWLALQWPWTTSQRPFCVVDCGTAVTVDAVDAEGQHLGGWIMAGLPSLARGLADLAPQLPQADLNASTGSMPATDSAVAIGSGFRMQLLGGVEHALAQLRTRLGPDLACWITGGDALSLQGDLNQTTRHDPDLVLRGLALAGVAE